MSDPVVYCEDWSCPARVSCERHFGRSKQYAAMSERPRYLLRKFERPDGADACAAYEFDRKKKWLMPQPGQVTHLTRGTQ